MAGRSFRFALALALSVAASALSASCSQSPSSPTPVTLRVISVFPSAGSTTGGATITITGTEFAADATVSVGGVPATDVVVQSATTIQATVAARSTPGGADVVVTSGGRTASFANGFTFVAPSGTNQPPVVTSIRSVGSRPNQPSGFGDVDETVTMLATVTDGETPASSLDYEWTGPGTVVGSTTSASWRLPASLSSTPAPLTLTLRVTETFVEGAITHRNVTTATFVMQAHDSQKEILDTGEDFLTLFSRSEVGTNEVLRNFSPTCDGGSGRSLEAIDVDRSREYYTQDFSKFRVMKLPPVTFNFGGRCTFRLRRADACSAFVVHWEVVYKKADAFHKVGDRETTDGIDYVTAVLENNVWRLCHSDFSGVSTNLTAGTTRLVDW